MIEKESQFSFAGSLKSASSEYLQRSGDAMWAVNDSSFDEYAGKIDFPGQGRLFEILEKQIDYSEHNTVLDIAGGSQGAAVQDLLRSKLVGRGLVTNFEDARTDETKAIETLDHITGDVSDERVWRSILEWKEEHAPEGFSVILHRPVGGLQDFTPEMYARPLHFLLDNLQPNGVLFTQVPMPVRISPRKVWFPVHLSVRSRKDIKDISYAEPIAGSKHPHVVITKQSER